MEQLTEGVKKGCVHVGSGRYHSHEHIMTVSRGGDLSHCYWDQPATEWSFVCRLLLNTNSVCCVSIVYIHLRINCGFHSMVQQDIFEW